MHTVVLFVGNDWAEDHHDVEVMDAAGRRLGRAKLDEGVAGMARLHAMIGEHLDPNVQDDELAEQVKIGIETDRGLDEEGIQVVIPSYYADDAHVVLLDVVVPGPGPVPR